MKTIKVDIVLEEGGVTPIKMTEGSAGYDLVCPQNIELKNGRGVIPLNIRLGIPL